MKLCLLLLLAFFGSIEGQLIFQEGQFVERIKEDDPLELGETFAKGMSCLECADWRRASDHFRQVANRCLLPSVRQDAFYYLGYSLYQHGEYDLANEAFSDYLSSGNSIKYFEDAIGYKFCIAEELRKGAKTRFFGSYQMPKWSSGHSLAVQIYDEILTLLPAHDYAAHSAYAKGMLLWHLREYQEAVDSFLLLIRRFPKHELAPESYVAISEIYLEQSCCEPQNSDLLALAQINQRRFTQEFPRDERLLCVETNLLKTRENHAKGLYETGRFYERTCHRHSALFYYRNAVRCYPETRIAELCRERLACLGEVSCEAESS
ncbi:MAG: tetratricopeptide repeat protein [Chlamydiia bacterium]|nr:tetratricopeptide repeat protein [Chlamydiia bacterium]